MNTPGVNKKEEVLNHWIAYADGFTLAPADFYTALERDIASRKIPGLDTSYVEYSEGGLLSMKRVYLRLMRERLAFDTCAAPFGESYFFSCRTVYSPPVIKLWHVAVLLLLSTGVYYLLVKPLGLTFAGVAMAGLLIALGQVFRNTVAHGLSDLDALLLKTPALGPVYEVLFRKETYFREDTRLVYLDAVPRLVKELASHFTAEKGLQLVRQYERAPTLGELYKPISPPRENK